MGKQYYMCQISVSTHGPQGAITLATADGRLCGTTYADASMSPAPNTDKNGIYALFTSATCYDHAMCQNMCSATRASSCSRRYAVSFELTSMPPREPPSVPISEIIAVIMLLSIICPSFPAAFCPEKRLTPDLLHVTAKNLPR